MANLTFRWDLINECTMQLETKFLRLRTPVTIGSRFGDS
jgi:hypothetical protein